MLRILFFSDTHLGLDYPLQPRLKIRRRGPDFFDNYRTVLSRARENHADMIIHGGDLFYRSRIPDKIIEMAYGPLIETAASGIPVCIVPGNHELSRLADQQVLDHSNISVFDRPRTYYFTLQGTTVAVSGFPFIRKNIRSKITGLIRDTIGQRQPAQIRLLCFHQAIEGAVVGRQNYSFRSAPDVIDMQSLTEKFDAVLAGHLHRHQVLKTAGNVPVIYPGSTERTSIAEIHEQKGFCWLDFDRGANSSWELTNIEFEQLPTRPLVELKLKDNRKTPDEIINWLNRRSSEIAADSVINVSLPAGLDTEDYRKLNSEAVRRAFPDTMTVRIVNSHYSRRPRASRLRLFDYDPDGRNYTTPKDR